MSNGRPGTEGDSWKVFQGTYGESPMILRVDEAYRHGKPPAGYEYQMGVTVPFKDASPDGLPGPADMGDLEVVEDLVASEPRGLLVAVITTQGMREFVLYTADPSWVEDWAHELGARVPGHEVQVMVQGDPGWETYRQLLAGA